MIGGSKTPATKRSYDFLRFGPARPKPGRTETEKIGHRYQGVSPSTASFKITFCDLKLAVAFSSLQNGPFIDTQSKHEVFREAVDVAPDGLDQRACLDAVERGKLYGEQYPVAAHDQNRPGNRRIECGNAPNADFRLGKWQRHSLKAGRRTPHFRPRAI